MAEAASEPTAPGPANGNPAAADTSRPQQAPPAAEPAQNGAPDWRQELPEDIRGEKLWDRYKSREEAARAHINLAKLQGRQIPAPRPDVPRDSPEWEDFVSKLRPASPDAYQIPRPEDPELLARIGWSEDTATEFRALAHKIGLHPHQVAALGDWDLKRAMRNVDAQQVRYTQERAKAAEELGRSWGPLAERNRALAVEAFQRFAGADADAFEEKYGDDPVMLRVLSGIGEMLFEKGEIAGDPSMGLMSHEAAQAKLDEIKAERLRDRKHPMNDPAHPQHRTVREEYRRLLALAQPPQERRRASR